jgi:hypothetical protein
MTQMLAVVPDLLGALRAYLLANPQVMSLATPDVPMSVAANVIPENVRIGTRMVLFRPGGGLGAMDEVKLAQPRIDFFFHGESPYAAGLVYRTVHPVLVGDPANGRSNGFAWTIGSVQMVVASIVQETAQQMLPALPSGQNWPAMFAAYRVTHSEVPF